MTWDEYYEKFYDWATSTQIRRLSALTSYGSPAEVTEVAMELCDEKAASRLINRALDAGVTFQVENIEDLNCCVDTATMKRVVPPSKEHFPMKRWIPSPAAWMMKYSRHF